VHSSYATAVLPSLLIDSRLHHRVLVVAAILAFGAIVALTLFRSGPLTQPGQPQPADPALSAALDDR
jgi:hypothetical protein